MPKSEYYILGGGSLVLFGIKEKTSDLDLCVSEELFEELKKKYDLTEDKKNDCGFYHISDLIEIIPNPKSTFINDEIDGYKVEKLDNILSLKKKRHLPKDQQYIKKIEEYIEKHSTK